VSKFENCARWGLGGGPATVPSVIRRVSALDGGVFVWATPSGAATLTNNTAKAETRNGQIFCIRASSCVRSAVRLFQGSRSSRLRVNSAKEGRGEPPPHVQAAPTADTNSSRWYLSRRAMSRHFRRTGVTEYSARIARITPP